MFTRRFPRSPTHSEVVAQSRPAVEPVSSVPLSLDSAVDEIVSYRSYLNGAWFESSDWSPVTNPATGRVFARAGRVQRAQVAGAIESGQRAWREWRSLTARSRGDFLFKIAAGLEARSAEVAKAITLENGKPLAQSRAEVSMAADHFRWFAEEGRRAYGRVVPHQADGKRHLVLRSPVGVVGAIAPWNFPLALSARKVAPALAAGCPVILKPASSTPGSGALLAEIIHEAGLPAGVFQLVIGSAQDVAAEMLENPACRKISFTGSTAVGKKLIEGSAASVKKLSLELGGNAPVLVFGDADIGKAVAGALVVKFRNAGQSCVAANRLYVHRSIYSDFVERFVEGSRRLRVGDGLEAGVDVGPLVDQNALQEALALLDDAVAKGARVLCGGRRAGVAEGGFFLEPTVLTDVAPDSRCLREEIFAPIAPIETFEREAEVVARANDTPYGLAAYVFTNDLSRAWRLAEDLEAGTIAINDAVPATSNCPFGGLKESGLGRELGHEGLDAYLETKHIAIGLAEA